MTRRNNTFGFVSGGGGGMKKIHGQPKKACLTQPRKGKPCFSNRALVKAIFEALKCLLKWCFRGLKIGLY